MADHFKDNPNIQKFWPTLILTKLLDDHHSVNSSLLKLFYTHRENEHKPNSSSYASHDKLLKAYDDHPQLAKLATFIKDGVFEIASYANQKYWREKDQIDLILTGLWFQISNQYTFHETHVHGNCSWSGVYYVQSGECGSSAGSEIQKENGITRFYGPYLDSTGGGHTDYGNIYLQDYAWNSYPEDGKLVVFPSYLKHMAYPYHGKNDRVIVSFHAQVNNASGFEFDYDMNN